MKTKEELGDEFMGELREFVITYSENNPDLFTQVEKEGKRLEITITLRGDTIGGTLRFTN